MPNVPGMRRRQVIVWIMIALVGVVCLVVGCSKSVTRVPASATDSNIKPAARGS